MVNSALGLQDDDDRESSDSLLLALGRSSARIALDCVSAVGSTGSLISSCKSAGVRGVSMVLEDDDFGVEREMLGVIMMSRKRMNFWRRWWRTMN